MNDEKLYWLGFSAFPGIGPVRFKLLVNYFGSAKNAWHASYKDLVDINLGEKLANKFVTFRNSFSVFEFEKELWEKKIKYITFNDSRYPKLLKQISDAPFVVYIKGRKTDKVWDIEKSLGVVGTRNITDYGREVTEKITAELVNCGFTVVSGMAYGVDACAHETAIKYGGKTIAVLGCGVDLIRPLSNKDLYNKIVDGHGAVVSEFPPGMESSRGLFPSRNRIISGLSLGVVVTEGAEDSGSLITASYAGEQGREVFAIPGPITSRFSKGPTKLLKAGAKMVTEVGDILEELKIADVSVNQLSSVTKKSMDNLTKEESRIIEFLQSGSLHFDELVIKSGIVAKRLGEILSLMELKGLLKSAGNSYTINIS